MNTCGCVDAQAPCTQVLTTTRVHEHANPRSRDCTKTRIYVCRWRVEVPDARGVACSHATHSRAQCRACSHTFQRNSGTSQTEDSHTLDALRTCFSLSTLLVFFHDGAGGTESSVDPFLFRVCHMHSLRRYCAIRQRRGTNVVLDFLGVWAKRFPV